MREAFLVSLVVFAVIIGLMSLVCSMPVNIPNQYIQQGTGGLG